MEPKSLQQIDQNLIELLGQRIALLKTAQPNREENTARVAQQLACAGVPASVWKALVVSCQAAIAAYPPAPTDSPRRVTIVGGLGKMGRFFTQQLTLAGHKVTILERDNWDEAEQLLGQAELVLICVPLNKTLVVIKRIVPYLDSSTTLAEITSLKTNLVQQMLARHSGPVVGLHPLFGQGVQSFLAQNILVCPGRQLEAYQWFLDFMETQGGKLRFCTPQDHDRMMEIVQAVRYFLNFSLGVFLAESGVDVKRSLQVSSPLYRIQIDLVSRLFAQDSSLFLGIMMAAEAQDGMLSKVAETFQKIAHLIAREESAVLAERFEFTRRTLHAEELNRAQQEVDHLMESLSIFLAYQETE